MAYITGSRLKVERAGKHLNELERKVRSFLDRHPDRFTRQLDPNDFNYVIYEIPPNPPPPPTLAPVLGDFVHNLRSALDHSAWNLALLNLQGTDREPYEFTAFPILRNASDGSVHRFYELVQDVLPAAIPDIEALQPDHQGNAANHELVILDALWNADKHRVNIPIPGRQTIREYTGPGGWLRNLGDGTRLMRVAVNSEPELHLEPYITSEVMFEIPKTGERVSLGVLRDIYDFVRSGVLPRFSGFLPESTGLVERRTSFKDR
jgi:hypothetical protein